MLLFTHLNARLLCPILSLKCSASTKMSLKSLVKVSFDAVAREKSIGYNPAHACFNCTSFGQYSKGGNIVQFPTSSYHIQCHVTKMQKNAFYLNGLNLFVCIFCTIIFQKPFRRNLSMHFGLQWKIKKLEIKGKCASLTTLLRILFCFPFCRKTHAWIPRTYDVLSNCFKIQQLQSSLEEKSNFFSRHRYVMAEFSAAWCLSIVGQAAKPTYIRIKYCQSSHRGR